MTRERAKNLLPVITAWAEGKDIEMVTKDCDGRPLFFKALRNARFDHSEWRICEPKPEVGMDKTQEEKFKVFNDEQAKNDGTLHAACNFVRRNTWQACLEANGIGEEPRTVEATAIEVGGYFKIDWDSRPWASEVRVGYASKDMRPDAIGDRIVTIPRPVPAWEPRDGEAVLIRLRSVYDWIAGAGVYDDGKVAHGSQVCVNYQIKPFDASKIGKPWSEI